MTAYRYISPSGDFLIYPTNGWWELMINGQRISEYSTPEAAAYDVSAQNTGYMAWDGLEDAEAPDTLDGWECIEYGRD